MHHTVLCNPQWFPSTLTIMFKSLLQHMRSSILGPSGTFCCTLITTFLSPHSSRLQPLTAPQPHRDPLSQSLDSSLVFLSSLLLCHLYCFNRPHSLLQPAGSNWAPHKSKDHRFTGRGIDLGSAPKSGVQSPERSWGHTSMGSFRKRQSTCVNSSRATYMR